MAHFTNCSRRFIRGRLNLPAVQWQQSLDAGTLRSLKVRTVRTDFYEEEKTCSCLFVFCVFRSSYLLCAWTATRPGSSCSAARLSLCGFCSLVGQADVSHQQLFGCPSLTSNIRFAIFFRLCCYSPPLAPLTICCWGQFRCAWFERYFLILLFYHILWSNWISSAHVGALFTGPHTASSFTALWNMSSGSYCGLVELT